MFLLIHATVVLCVAEEFAEHENLHVYDCCYSVQVQKRGFHYKTPLHMPQPSLSASATQKERITDIYLALLMLIFTGLHNGFCTLSVILLE